MSDIKDYRNKELKSYVIGNILLILFFSGPFKDIFLQDIDTVLDIWGTIIESALVSSIIYIYVFLLDSLLPGNLKQRIAYFPKGKLPGYTIFTEMNKKVTDDRFTKESILEKYNEIYVNMPSDKKDREKYENAQWYKIYQKHKNDSKILTSNRDFLLCRDIVILTLMLFISYCIFSMLKVVDFSCEVIFILFLELVVSDIAMRGKGKRLAYNVISEDVYN